MDQTKKPEVVAPEDQEWNDRLVPIAKAVFKAIAEHIDDAPISVVSTTDFTEWVKPFVKQALEGMLAADLRKKDYNILMQAMMQPIAQVMDRVQSSVDMNYEKAICDVFGAENEYSVTMKQIHAVLMKGAGETTE